MADTNDAPEEIKWIQSINLLRSRTTFSYDAVGNLVTLLDARGNMTTSAYDEVNRTLAKVDALGNRTTFSCYAAR